MRVFKVIGGVFAALLLAVLAVLAETHLEMARVDPELPTLESLAALRETGEGPDRVRFVNTSSQAGESPATLVHASIVLEWSGGRTFLIDAGMRRDEAVEFGKLGAIVFGAGPPKIFGSIQELLGPAAARVEGIAFTHLHSDHTDGLHALCAARSQELAVYQTPDQATRSNLSTWPGKATLREAGCARPTTLAGGPPLFPVPDFPGLYAVAAGGHTPGSTVYLANMRGELWVFAGDITNFMLNLREDRAKPLAYRVLIGESSARQAKLRHWLGELDRLPGYTVVVAHDLEALETVMPPWTADAP